MNKFTLDDVDYEIDTMPEEAKVILNNIIKIQEKQIFEYNIYQEAINSLTYTLSKYKDSFVKVTNE